MNVAGPDKLKGIDVDMFHISDTVLTLAALAPLADGPTTIRNIANIRIKETDRLVAIVNELRRLGQGVEHGEDWITGECTHALRLSLSQSAALTALLPVAVTPAPVMPAEIECYADHRIAMSFAVLGCAVAGVTIKDPACTAKTYPKFFEDLEEMRGKVGGEPASKKQKA